jgi:hypothetical protein
MKVSQKVYESTNLNNIINKEHSIHFHKQNLNKIKRGRSIFSNTKENEYSANRIAVNNPNGKFIIFKIIFL